MVMNATPSETRIPANMRGSAAGNATRRKMPTGPVSSDRAARTSSGSTYFTPAMTFATITQKHA